MPNFPVTCVARLHSQNMNIVCISVNISGSFISCLILMLLDWVFVQEKNKKQRTLRRSEEDNDAANYLA